MKLRSFAKAVAGPMISFQYFVIRVLAAWAIPLSAQDSASGYIGSAACRGGHATQFRPHVGFAYSFSPKTVVRGSFALFFGALQSVSGSTHNQVSR